MRISRYIGIAAIFGALAGCGPSYKLNESCQNFMTQEYGPGFYRQCWHRE